MRRNLRRTWEHIPQVPVAVGKRELALSGIGVTQVRAVKAVPVGIQGEMIAGGQVGTWRKVVLHMNVYIHVRNHFPRCAHMHAYGHPALYPYSHLRNFSLLCTYLY